MIDFLEFLKTKNLKNPPQGLMKILIISQYFWPEEFRINDLALGLIDRGHEVTILTGIPNYPYGKFFDGYNFYSPKQENYKGIKIIRVPLIPRGKGKGWNLALNYLSYVVSACLLGSWKLKGEFDSIFVYQTSPATQGIPGVLFRWLKKTPMLFWVQDLWPESLTAAGGIQSKLILNPVKKMVAWLYNHSDMIPVQSPSFKDHVTKTGGDSKKVSFLPNWVESLYQPLSPDYNSPEFKKLPKGFRITFAGNIGVAQSFETILATAKKLQNYEEIQWIILGDGLRFSWVQEQIQKLGLEKCVHLLGRQPMESMPKYFSLSDALLVTLKNEEIFNATIPGKIQSYLACNRPILASLGGEGANVIKKSEAGFTSCPEDAEALAEVVLKLYHLSPEERQSMGDRGRAYYEANFEREMLIDRVENWMIQLKNGEKCES